MKRFSFVILIVTASFSAKAQSFKLIAEAGLSESTLGPAVPINQGTATGTNTYSTATGFYAGLSAEFSLGKFSLDPALHFSQIGTAVASAEIISTPYGPLVTASKITDRLDYVELPVNLLYHFNDGKTYSFFVGAGPYIALGLSGQTNINASISYPPGYPTTSTYYGPLSFSDKDNFTDHSTRRYIYGANALVGVTLPKHFRVSVAYDYCISGPYFSSPKIYDHTFKLQVGYAFR